MNNNKEVCDSSKKKEVDDSMIDEEGQESKVLDSTIEDNNKMLDSKKKGITCSKHDPMKAEMLRERKRPHKVAIIRASNDPQLLYEKWCAKRRAKSKGKKSNKEDAP
ncbi:hypothetical protein ACFE04_031813 [Oxalis oulophora]